MSESFIMKEINVLSHACITFYLPKEAINRDDIEIMVIYGENEDFYTGNVWARVGEDIVQGFISSFKAKKSANSDAITSIITGLNGNENFLPTLIKYIQVAHPNENL